MQLNWRALATLGPEVGSYLVLEDPKKNDLLLTLERGGGRNKFFTDKPPHENPFPLSLIIGILEEMEDDVEKIKGAPFVKLIDKQKTLSVPEGIPRDESGEVAYWLSHRHEPVFGEMLGQEVIFVSFYEEDGAYHCLYADKRCVDLES